MGAINGILMGVYAVVKLAVCQQIVNNFMLNGQLS